MDALESDFNDDEVVAKLADLEQRAKRLGPAFRALRRPFRGDQIDHARGEQGPGGKWPARSPLTEARRLARNRNVRVTKAMKSVMLKKPTKRSTPKRLLGRLPGAVAYRVGELFIRATSRATFGGAHQKGATVGRGSRLPARAFLWLSDGLIAKTRELLAEHVMKGWDK